MAFKFVIALAIVAVASAGYIPPQQGFYQAANGPVEHTVSLAPSDQHLVAKKVEEYDPHPQYKFAYDVQDSITGDSKSHSETRDGDSVEGEYTLIDSDGFKRIVHYTADKEHGFNAVVSRVPLNEAHHETKTAPTVYASPSGSYPVNYNSHTGAALNSYKPAIPIGVVKNVAPASYASPIGYYKSEGSDGSHLSNAAPASYSAPSYYKSAPVAPESNAHGQESYSALLSSGYQH
ncbi:cuticle protein 21-like [Eupeodes corollae]|uniref:cuticle protein 21-like n=1 Tax=Eupeodes corollae TaxID=290404 RepID=UPI00248FF81D|nr:cuticle protein 21-like [Eupeodes corollae]